MALVCVSLAACEFALDCTIGFAKAYSAMARTVASEMESVAEKAAEMESAGVGLHVAEGAHQSIPVDAGATASDAHQRNPDAGARKRPAAACTRQMALVAASGDTSKGTEDH